MDHTRPIEYIAIYPAPATITAVSGARESQPRAVQSRGYVPAPNVAGFLAHNLAGRFEACAIDGP